MLQEANIYLIKISIDNCFETSYQVFTWIKYYRTWSILLQFCFFSESESIFRNTLLGKLPLANLLLCYDKISTDEPVPICEPSTLDTT